VTRSSHYPELPALRLMEIHRGPRPGMWPRCCYPTWWCVGLGRFSAYIIRSKAGRRGFLLSAAGRMDYA
jgi:hypothetical protein